MKKLIVMSGLALLLMASCKKKEEPVPPAAPPPVEDPAPPPAPKPQTTTTTNVTVETTEKDPDGTSVNVSSDGISVQNKKGDAKNNVTISKKKAEVEIKTP